MRQSRLIIKLLISFMVVSIAIAADPFITEYIIPFDIPIEDFKSAVENQLSHNQFKTNNFTTDNVTVSKLIYKATYNGSERIVDPKQQSLLHNVTKDSVDLVVTYQAIVHKSPVTKKTYNGTTRLKIYLNYFKRLVPQNDTVQVSALTVSVDKNSFVMNYSGNPSSAEISKLNEINNGVVSGKKNTTILLLLEKQEFTKEGLLTYFKENLVNQKISPTYDSIYNYTFNKMNAIFDMTTAGVKQIQHGIGHFLKAKIKNFGQQSCLHQYINSPSPMPKDGFHTLFSFDFINYFLKYSMQNNPDWVSFKINKNTFKLYVFKFKLVDLQYLFDKIVTKYAEYYLNDISIVCSPVSFDNWGVDNVKNVLTVQMMWNCKGWLDGPTPPPLILNFNSTLSHQNQVRLSDDRIYVYLAQTNLNSLSFETIQDSPLLDPQLALLYGNEIVDRLRGYTIGSGFKVKAGSSNLVLEENVGVYVG